MLAAQAIAPPDRVLSAAEIRETLRRGLDGRFANRRVLVLIPDHTRTIPLPQLFRYLVDILQDARQLTFMVALGTHPPLGEAQLQRLLGITAEERATRFKHVAILNHQWDTPGTLTSVGTITSEQVRALAGKDWHDTLDGDVDIRINRAVLEHDDILILGPTFPHEVAGFSGGAKYLFPGVSGPEMINKTHWLGALAGVVNTIGIQDTPVRAMIHAAAEQVPTPITLIALVIVAEGVAAMLIGDHLAAWRAAVGVSTERHIIWVERPFRRILSWAPRMYDELWTAAKAMYKLEPVLAEGGELILYAPHLGTISHVHGRYIEEIGYHCLPYFLNQWERFKHVPLGVLAHSTHFRGAGRFEASCEYPRTSVTLASQLSAEVCARLALGYANPAGIDPAGWQNREEEGILFVSKAGEMLYRVRPSKSVLP
jgi:nickel-dependent lactate racemase